MSRNRFSHCREEKKPRKIKRNRRAEAIAQKQFLIARIDSPDGSSEPNLKLLYEHYQLVFRKIRRRTFDRRVESLIRSRSRRLSGSNSKEVKRAS